MRSRFTAFAVGDTGYLLSTWHPDTRPAVLDLDPDQHWYRLDIVRTERGGPLDDQGVVAFVAHYRSGRERGRLAETSRFVRVDRQWLYVEALSQD